MQWRNREYPVPPTAVCLRGKMLDTPETAQVHKQNVSSPVLKIGCYAAQFYGAESELRGS